MSKAGTAKVAPTVKISSVKVPNAAQAAKPIVTKKASLKFQKNNNPSQKTSNYRPPKAIQ